MKKSLPQALETRPCWLSDKQELRNFLRSL